MAPISPTITVRSKWVQQNLFKRNSKDLQAMTIMLKKNVCACSVCSPDKLRHSLILIENHFSSTVKWVFNKVGPKARVYQQILLLTLKKQETISILDLYLSHKNVSIIKPI